MIVFRYMDFKFLVNYCVWKIIIIRKVVKRLYLIRKWNCFFLKFFLVFRGNLVELFFYSLVKCGFVFIVVVFFFRVWGSDSLGGEWRYEKFRVSRWYFFGGCKFSEFSSLYLFIVIVSFLFL